MSLVESHLEKRLQEWALWYTRQEDVGIGYPHRSIEGRLQDDYIFFPAKGGGYQGIPYSSIAAEIEKLVVELSDYQALLADVLRADYTQTGTQGNKAKNLGISLAQFKFCAKLAKAWLCGHYSAILANTAKFNGIQR
ncbi:MAG: hypothetical protein K0S11_294 [Gammaproteobacteria bacterium]|jgi:hypothetical protein|nr:hypothetical protein [Gammaproteobacteria bacterium]